MGTGRRQTSALLPHHRNPPGVSSGGIPGQLALSAVLTATAMLTTAALLLTPAAVRVLFLLTGRVLAALVLLAALALTTLAPALLLPTVLPALVLLVAILIHECFSSVLGTYVN